MGGTFGISDELYRNVGGGTFVPIEDTSISSASTTDLMHTVAMAFGVSLSPPHSTPVPLHPSSPYPPPAPRSSKRPSRSRCCDGGAALRHGRITMATEIWIFSSLRRAPSNQKGSGQPTWGQATASTGVHIAMNGATNVPIWKAATTWARTAMRCIAMMVTAASRRLMLSSQAGRTLRENRLLRTMLTGMAWTPTWRSVAPKRPSGETTTSEPHRAKPS